MDEVNRKGKHKNLKELIDAFANLSLTQKSLIEQIPVHQQMDLEGITFETHKLTIAQEKAKEHPFIKDKLQRVQEENERVMRKFNFNWSGRYNGGVPNKVGECRGSALNVSGKLVTIDDMDEIQGTGTSTELFANREDVRANTNYYKSEKEIHAFRKTYFQNEVEDVTPSLQKWKMIFLVSLAVMYILHKYNSKGGYTVKSRAKWLSKISDDSFDSDGFLMKK
jgi:hypothetical protein